MVQYVEVAKSDKGVDLVIFRVSLQYLKDLVQILGRFGHSHQNLLFLSRNYEVTLSRMGTLLL